MTAAVAATALAACSDGSSKEDFVAAADEICREADAKIQEIGSPLSGDEIFDYVDDAREISQDLVGDLRALDPPAADEEEVDEMIDGLERATDLLEPLAQATVDRNAPELAELQQEITQITDEVSEFAEEYGFEACGAKVLDPAR